MPTVATGRPTGNDTTEPKLTYYVPFPPGSTGRLEAETNWLLLAAVPIVGFAAGFINTLAGSGSLITLPVLILLGLPANVANGTNRVGILIQNIVAVTTFHRRGVLRPQGSIKLILPAIIGSIVGAALAVDLDESLLNRTIGSLMLVMLVVVIARPRRWIETHASGSAAPYWVQALAFFGVGAYGGFIQAGVGVFLLASLVLAGGYSLVGANAVKNLIVLAFTIAALVVFVINDQVRWGLGLLLGSGNAVGAFIAARMAVAKGAGFVRNILIAILLVSAIAMLTDFRLA